MPEAVLSSGTDQSNRNSHINSSVQLLTIILTSQAQGQQNTAHGSFAPADFKVKKRAKNELLIPKGNETC